MMEPRLMEVARHCIEGAESGTMDFPQIVATLRGAGFDGYHVDYRRSATTCYLPTGESVEIAIAANGDQVAEHFDADGVAASVREAQTKAPGYSYHGFSRKVKLAGCAGYLVSFPGLRVLYYGRTAETHVEFMPQ